jgi:hypothetical protein
MKTVTRITFELLDSTDYSVVHRKVYEPHSEEKVVDALTEIAHIHSFESKCELLRRLKP